MEQGFSILMFIFAGALLLYAGLMALIKDYKMLPYRARQSVKPKNPKKYMVQLAKIVALVAAMIAAGAAVALWNGAVGAVVIVVDVVAALWCGTKIIKKAEE
ncbi:MAG: hypothetical protein IJ899_06530 [Blautia sp.]|nr:hypothetical protein [Blautia sp.]